MSNLDYLSVARHMPSRCVDCVNSSEEDDGVLYCDYDFEIDQAYGSILNRKIVYRHRKGFTVKCPKFVYDNTKYDERYE